MGSKASAQLPMKALFCVLGTVVLAGTGFAADYDVGVEQYKKDTVADVATPEGMEKIRMGDGYVVVPKGGIVRKEGNLYFIESAEEYGARKFEEVEDRLDRIEKELGEIKDRIGEIREPEKG